MVMDPMVGSKRIALSKQIQVNKPIEDLGKENRNMLPC